MTRVSISTVSNVLNRPERVLAAVDELGFVPKPDAVSQARRETGVMQELRATGLDTRVVDTKSAVEARLIEHELPTVVVDAYSDVFSTVTVEDRRGGALATGKTSR